MSNEATATLPFLRTTPIKPRSLWGLWFCDNGGGWVRACEFGEPMICFASRVEADASAEFHATTYDIICSPVRICP